MDVFASRQQLTANHGQLGRTFTNTVTNGPLGYPRRSPLNVVLRQQAMAAADLPLAKRNFHYVAAAGDLFRCWMNHCARTTVACNTLHLGLYRIHVIRRSAGKEAHWRGKYRRSQLAWGDSDALE